MFKKIFGVAFLAVALLLASGCGDDDAKEDHKTPKVGTLAQLNTTPVQMDEVLAKMGVASASEYYDDMTTLMMAMSSKTIDSMITYRSVAGYLKQKSDGINIAGDVPLEDKFCFAVREDDKELRDTLNGVIRNMKSDGTLEKLTRNYITGMNLNPEPAEIPEFDGAGTLKVAITGDLPPLDYVSPDGKPAGFNTAILAEVARRIQKNIVPVQVASSARASALLSKRVDIIFWVVVPAETNGRRKDMDMPSGVAETDSYYSDTYVKINLNTLAEMAN